MSALLLRSFFLGGFLFLVGVPAWASSVHKGLTFQGFLKDAHGNRVTSSGVTITSRVVSPNGCVLMSETHSGVNIADGFFTVVIGKGARSPGEPGFSLKEVFSNSAPRSGLNPVSGTAGSCNYTPVVADARKLSLSFQIGADTIATEFNVRANAFSVWAESSEDASKLDGKSASAFLQTNVSAGLSQVRLEEFVQALTSVTGGAVRWNGTNFVSYNPSDASYLSSNTVADAHIQSMAWTKLSAVPSGLTQIGALSCAEGKILKRVSGSWACADDDSGGGGGGSGDATSIHGVGIAAGAPGNGNFLKYNGTSWDDAAITISDVNGLSAQLGGKLDQSQMPASCAANQTLHFVSVTGSWTCFNIDGLNASRVTAGTFDIARLPTGSTGATVAVGNDSRFPVSGCASGNINRWNGSSWVCEAPPSGGSMSYNTITSNTTAVAGNAYLTDSASRLTVTLPSTCTVGQQVLVMGIHTGGWRVAASGSMTIYDSLGNQSIANGGFNSSTSTGTVQLTCIRSDSAWLITHQTSTYSTAPQTIILTSGTSWTVPTNWNPTGSTIEVIGGGAGGGGGVNNHGGSGGGGGGYSKATDVALTPGSAVAYAIGSGGTTNVSGGDTYFCNANTNCASIAGSAVVVGAKGGTTGGWATGSPGGAGGSAAAGVGDVRHSGGNGGDSAAGRAGGGAAGPNGDGLAGNPNGTGGTGNAGLGGVGGAAAFPGLPGAAGTEWTTAGSGGGGGACSTGTGNGGAGGLYGGGGGSSCQQGAAGTGGAGVIVIKYYP